MKKYFIIIFIIFIGTGLFIFFTHQEKVEPVIPDSVVVEDIGPKKVIIGTSVERRAIEAYTYGNGNTHLVFVGGIHGGYEWNSVVLAYEVMDYLTANPSVIPNNISVTIIPSANPDGVFKVVGKEGRFTASDVPVKISTAPGRFNAHLVDLNRNFDCKWQPKSSWQNKVVSAGTKAFSEPESAALQNFVIKNNPRAFVFWHSQSGAVYASRCEDGTLAETVAIMNIYAKASGYKAVETFDAYATTGDAEAWLASINIPAITVELTTHESIELEKNLEGLKVLFEYYK
ncbi:MAG: M14 family metallopeptidase [Minisyncoccota bacterium]